MTNATQRLKDWLGGFAAIDGGDIGNYDNPSIWLCGIEWGIEGNPFNASAEELAEAYYSNDTSSPPLGFEDGCYKPDKKAWETLISYNFGWQSTKLLASINGEKVEDYPKFARRVEPFTKGKKGYFKLNLYPFAFKNTNEAHWTNSNFPEFTGINTKAEYLELVKEVRFPKMREWVAEYRPKLIICFGKTYLQEFKMAFAADDTLFQELKVGDRIMRWAKSNETLIVVLPFPSGRWGLNGNALIQLAGEEISKLQKRAN